MVVFLMNKRAYKTRSKRRLQAKYRHYARSTIVIFVTISPVAEVVPARTLGNFPAAPSRSPLAYIHRVEVGLARGA